jgi:hypothetical protein
MDLHDDWKLPDQAIQQITQDTKERKFDEFGVRRVELFHKPDGKVYCLIEAPDAESGDAPVPYRRPIPAGNPDLFVNEFTKMTTVS